MHCRAIAANSIVIAGLDRVIQEKPNALNILLDGRIKSGHDSERRH